MAVYPKKGRKGPNGEPLWRVVVWSRGRSHERSIHGTKREATAFEARLRVELESAPVESSKSEAPKSYDLVTFCRDVYAPHAQAHLRASTYDVRRYQIANVLRVLGPLDLTAITTTEIERYKGARAAAGAKPRTINTELAKLQAVLTHAKNLGVPCATPKIRRLPEIGRGRVTFWTSEQLGALLAAVEQEAPDLLGIVVFLANTGARKGEALALEQSWIDLKRGLICIQPSEHWQPKDNEPREIPISDALRPWLERALAVPGRYVFVTTKKRGGERTRWACWPRLAFDRARKAAGLRGGPHTLRHSFAAHFLAGCPDMFLLSQLLGHSHSRTTKIYSHLLPSHLERARGVVNVGPSVGPAAMEARKRWGA